MMGVAFPPGPFAATQGLNRLAIEGEAGVGRRHSHEEHFAFDGTVIRGLTPAGRTTVELLAINAPGQLEIRAQIGKGTAS